MKNYSSLIFFLLVLYFRASGQDEVIQRCYTKRKAPNISNQKLSALSKVEVDNSININGVIRIPVVFHILHNKTDGKIGGAGNPNISDEQIYSQIKVLNEDFRRKCDTKGYNANAVGADTEIEFYLATLDSYCQTTTGITRHFVSKVDFQIDTDEAFIKSFGYWKNDKYLNIWVCSILSGFGGQNVLGLTQFPSNSGLSGLPSDGGGVATDGILIAAKVVGSNTGIATTGIYKYGRTLTHEIGHWLGLIHTWGDELCGNDFCNDTPTCEDSNKNLNCADVFSNCNGDSTRNMIENYMDYSPDVCMNIFTLEQKARMRKTLSTSTARISLWKNRYAACLNANIVTNYVDPKANSTFCGTATGLTNASSNQNIFTMFPNPTTNKIVITVDTIENLIVYNYLGIKVLEEKLIPNQNEISLINLPKGLYFIKIRNQIEKLILN
jgi:hypothetical protein